LLILDRNRLNIFPGVPSLTDVGMADSRLDNWFVIMVNRSANAQQLTQVRRAVTAAINTPDLVLQLQSMGLHGVGNKKSNSFLVDEQRNFERVLKVIKIDE
jgi:tripartite-type tricarboxylate transporter receptor subunit TctC